MWTTRTHKENTNTFKVGGGSSNNSGGNAMCLRSVGPAQYRVFPALTCTLCAYSVCQPCYVKYTKCLQNPKRLENEEEQRALEASLHEGYEGSCHKCPTGVLIYEERPVIPWTCGGLFGEEWRRKSANSMFHSLAIHKYHENRSVRAKREENKNVIYAEFNQCIFPTPPVSSDPHTITPTFPIPSVHYSRGACGIEGGIVRYTVANHGPKQSCVWCLVSSSKRNEDRQYGGPGGRMGTQTIVPVVRWEVPPTLPGVPADEFELEVPMGMWGYDIGLEDDDNVEGRAETKSEIPRRVHQLALYRESELFRVGEEDAIATSNTIGKRRVLRSHTDEIVRQQSIHRMSLPPTRTATAHPNTTFHTDNQRGNMFKAAVRGPLMVLTILHPAPALQQQQLLGSKRDRDDNVEREAHGEPPSSTTNKPPPTDVALAVDNLLHGRNVACYGYGSKIDFLRGVALSSCFASLPVHEVYCFNTPTSYNHNQQHFTEMQERHEMLLASMNKLTEGRNKVGPAKLPNGMKITTSHQANMGLVLRSVEDEIKLLAAQHEEQAVANGKAWVDKGVLFGGQRLPYYPAPHRPAADEGTMPPPSFTPSRRQPSDQAQATSTPRANIGTQGNDEAGTRLDISEAFSPAPKAPSTPLPIHPQPTTINTTMAPSTSSGDGGGELQKSVVRRLDMQVDYPTTPNHQLGEEDTTTIMAEEIDHNNDDNDLEEEEEHHESGSHLDDDSSHHSDNEVDDDLEEEQQHMYGSREDDDSSISLKQDDAEEGESIDGVEEDAETANDVDMYADDDDDDEEDTLEGSHVGASHDEVEENNNVGEEELAGEEEAKETDTVEPNKVATEVEQETVPVVENATGKQTQELDLRPPPPPPGDDTLPPRAPLSASPSSRKLFKDAIGRAPSAAQAALSPSKARPISKKRLQAVETFDLMDPLNADGGWATSVSFSYVSKLESEHTTTKNNDDNDNEEEGDSDYDMDMDDTARAPGEVEAMISRRPRHHRVNPTVSAALLLNCYPTVSWESSKNASGAPYMPSTSASRRYFHPAPFRQILVLHGIDSLDAANLQHLERLITTCNASSTNPLCCELLILCSVDDPNWLAGNSSTAPSGAVGTAGQGGGAVSGARVGKASSYNAYYTASGRNTTTSLFNTTHTPSTLSPATNVAALSFASKCKFSAVHLTTKEYAYMPFIQEAAHITDLALLMDASRASGSVNTGGGPPGIPTGLRPGSLVLGGDPEEDVGGGVDDGVEFLSDAVSASDDDEDDDQPIGKGASSASHRQPTAGRRGDNNTRSNMGVRTTGGAANIFDSTSSAMDTIERVLVSVPDTFRMVFRHILLLQEETVAANPVLTGKKAAAAAKVAEEDDGRIDAGPPKAGDVFDQVSSGSSEAELDIRSNIKMHSVPINSIAPYVERSANNTILLSTARLRSVIVELTSNSLAVYDEGTHSIFIPHHRRVMKVLAMVDRRSKEQQH